MIKNPYKHFKQYKLLFTFSYHWAFRLFLNFFPYKYHCKIFNLYKQSEIWTKFPEAEMLIKGPRCICLINFQKGHAIYSPLSRVCKFSSCHFLVSLGISHLQISAFIYGRNDISLLLYFFDYKWNWTFFIVPGILLPSSVKGPLSKQGLFKEWEYD